MRFAGQIDAICRPKTMRICTLLKHHTLDRVLKSVYRAVSEGDGVLWPYSKRKGALGIFDGGAPNGGVSLTGYPNNPNIPSIEPTPVDFFFVDAPLTTWQFIGPAKVGG